MIAATTQAQMALNTFDSLEADFNSLYDVTAWIAARPQVDLNKPHRKAAAKSKLNRTVTGLSLHVAPLAPPRAMNIHLSD